MPSTSSNFLYSLITMALVGSILTLSLASYINPLKERAEVNRLRDVLNQVANEAEEALGIISEHNATSHIFIQLPSMIGDRDYWIGFANDSSRVWVEGAFGRIGGSGGQKYCVYLAREAFASGVFEGRYVLALLNCSLSGTVPQLVLGHQGR